MKPHFQKELSAYRGKMANGYLQESWRHLERAHILGQTYPYQHSEAHWHILRFGFRIKDWKEIRGPKFYVWL